MPCPGHCVSLLGVYFVVYAVQADNSARDCATDDSATRAVVGAEGLFGQPRDQSPWLW